MDPAVEVLLANFKACRSYVRGSLAKITVSLYKDGVFTGDVQSFDRNGVRLGFDVQARDFDKIKFETFPGMLLESKGICLERILNSVAFYQPYDSIDVYQYTKYGGVELESFDFEEKDIEVDIYDDVRHVVVSLGKGYAPATVEEKVEGEHHTEGYDTCGR